MRIIVAALVAALIAAFGVPAHASDFVIKGRILATYTAAGGAAKLGDPVEDEVKMTLSGRNLYKQRFEHGVTFWSTYAGGKTATYPGMIGLSKVSNERDALASYGLKPGMVYRSAKLCGASTADKQIMRAQLNGGTIIDLRTSGAISGCKDPSIGVSRVNYPVNSDANYVRYVTDSARRAAFGKALKAILANAKAGRPVWVHCTAGKDRTGWTITVLLSILGADHGAIYAEHLRSAGASESRLVDGLDAVASRYHDDDWHGVTGSGMYGYVRALGLTDADIANLREALGA